MQFNAVFMGVHSDVTCTEVDNSVNILVMVAHFWGFLNDKFWFVYEFLFQII